MSPTLSFYILARSSDSCQESLVLLFNEIRLPQLHPSRLWRDENWQTREDSSCIRSQRCLNELPQTAGLSQHSFILSQFRRLEVQKQRVGRAALSTEALGQAPSLSSAAAGGSWLSLAQWQHKSNVCLHLHLTFSSLCLCVLLASVRPSLSLTRTLIGFGATLISA